MTALAEPTLQSAPEIREFSDVGVERFRNQIATQDEPAVLRGLAAAWPLVQASRRSDDALLDYVASFGRDVAVKAFAAAPGVEGRYFYSEDLQGFNFDRRELTLGALIDELRSLRGAKPPSALYAGAIPLRDALAGIRENNNLDVGPQDFTLAGQPVSLVNMADPDFVRFPKVRRAIQAASVAVLEPGDAIFISSMWFHQVESLDAIGALVNFWWRNAAPYMYSPLFTMLHALLSLRDLPETERRHWRRMFDHYIFQFDGEAMQHIPEEAQGFFGELTAEKVGRLRAYLVHSLGGQPRG